MSESVLSVDMDAMYAALLENLDEAVFLTDDGGKVLFASPNASRILGRPDIAAGGQIAHLLGSAAQLEAQGQTRDMQCTVVDSSGSTRYLLVRIKQVAIAAGTRLYLCRCAQEAGVMDIFLGEREARYRAVIRALPDLILRIRSDYSVIECIPANGSDMTLLPQPTHLSELVSKQAVENLMRATDEALQSGRMQVCEYNQQAADGVTTSEEARVVVDGPDTVLAIVRDVTERRRILAALENRERTASEFQHYLKELHQAHMELAAVDLKDFYQRVVEIGLHRLGFDRMGIMLVDYEHNEMVGVYGTDAHGQPRDESHYRVSLDSENGRVWEALNRKDYVGVWEHIPITEYSEVIGTGWNAIAGVWEGHQAVAYLSIDNFASKRAIRPYESDLLSLYASVVGSLIVRKQAEKTLRASENRFRTLLEAAPLGVLLLNHDGEVVSANHKAQELFGYTQADFTGVSLETIIPATSVETRSLRGAAMVAHLLGHSTSAGVVGLDLYGQRSSGYMFPLDAALSVIESDKDRMALVFVTDVTERRLADAQHLDLRLERERTTILTNFIRDAAHEFRTPLSIINTNLYLLNKATEPERRDELQARVQEQADSIARLVDVLTTMVRLDYGISDEMAPVNINNIVRATLSRVQPMMAEKSIQSQHHEAEPVALVSGDAGDLTLALTALLDNAIRYTPVGGQIRVKTERQGEFQHIIIRDTGTGMSPDVQERIFERFYRADYARTTRGFGLGLSIARKVIENHGGDISVESTPEAGSTFTLRLPLVSLM